MKNIIITSILFLAIIESSGNGQDIANITFPKKENSILSYDVNFNSTLVGTIYTVWQRVYPNPGYQDATSNALFASSDDSFYLSSQRSGGFITKFSKEGIIEWQIDHDYSRDTTVKIVSQYQQFIEQSNKEISIYGWEGQRSRLLSVGNHVPKRTVISPNGLVKEEKSTRGNIDPFFCSLPYTPFSDEVFYVSRVIGQLNTQSIFSMDTALSMKKYETSFVDELTTNDMSSFGGIFPYMNNTFITYYQGYTDQNVFSMILLQYSRDFKLIKRIIVPVSLHSSAIANEKGEILIAMKSENYRIHLKKLDSEGNFLWDKVPEIVRNISFRSFSLEKTRDGNFILLGELYVTKINGDADIYSEERMGFIGKITNDGNMPWYYTTGRKNFWNVIRNFSETHNGDIVFVCNSVNTSETLLSNPETPMQITRLRPRTSGVNFDPSFSRNSIIISPNPISTSFKISGIENISGMKVINLLGEIVVKEEGVYEEREIDISDLANGTYFALFRTATEIISKMIVVRH